MQHLNLQFQSEIKEISLQDQEQGSPLGPIEQHEQLLQADTPIVSPSQDVSPLLKIEKIEQMS